MYQSEVAPRELVHTSLSKIEANHANETDLLQNSGAHYKCFSMFCELWYPHCILDSVWHEPYPERRVLAATYGPANAGKLFICNSA